MTASTVRTEQELRSIIKAPPGTVAAKIAAGPLRATAVEFLRAARLGVVASVADGELRSSVVGGEAGFVTTDPTTGDLLIPGHFGGGVTFAGLLLMVPGVKHTLRVNGSAAVHEDGSVMRLTPQQSYAHCAKAFIRSALWADGGEVGANSGELEHDGQDQLDDATRRFVETSPFVTVGSSLASSDADVSPRGDPAGFVQVTDDGQLFVPERPGNRIADSLRNIVAQPRVSLLFLTPGDDHALEITGDATISTDPELRRVAEVSGRTPKLGVLVDVRSVRLSHEPSIAASGAWDQSTHVAEADLPTLGAMVADPKGSRSLARRTMANLTDRAVESDYKRNLY